MFIFKVFVFIITICVAKSEMDFKTTCKNDYRDEYNNTIDVVEYCSNKLCIEKCCGPSELLSYANSTCVPNNRWLQRPKLKASYDAINILSSLNVNKTSTKNVVFVSNHRSFKDCTSERLITDEYEISEDGSLSRQDTETKKWSTTERLLYCIDYKLHVMEKTPTIKIIIREIIADPKDMDKIEIFETVGVAISSFFLLLVLIVYCLLPELRNLSGLVLMAYTFSLLFAFITKLVITFIIKNPAPGFCKKITPVQYFTLMSSIFWLSVISYDVWSGLRRIRIKRGSKREELVRFLWYGLYAWGTPLLITAIVTTLDNIDISKLYIVKPPFNNCFHDDGYSFNYYFRIPIGILIIINIILFIMTIYNIWKVKHAVRNSNNSKQQNAKISTYAKLSVIMGVNWCMELIYNQNILWQYILVNFYNIFTGVTLFYLYVCDKKIISSLCKKFNIRNQFTKNLDAELSQRTKSGNTKSTFISRSTVKSKTNDQNQEPDLMQNGAKEESSLV